MHKVKFNAAFIYGSKRFEEGHEYDIEDEIYDVASKINILGYPLAENDVNKPMIADISADKVLADDDR